jgi:SH3 domain protein
MNYLLIIIFIVASYFAPNVMAQEAEVSEIEELKELDVIERLPAPLQRYIADEFYVPLRETPCSNCKIVHRGIKSGTAVKLIAEKEDWALVLTEKGVEGWMQLQHLTPSPIARVALTANQAKLKKLVSRNNQLEQIMSELRQQSKVLRGKLDSTEGSKENLAAELASIKEISSDVIALNEQNQSLVKHNHMLQRDFDVLKANFENLQNDKRNESFLYGGLTVFLGAILVVLIPKLRGRKRFSEWH